MKKKVVLSGIVSLFLLSINSAYASSPASTTIPSTKNVSVSKVSTTQPETTVASKVGNSTTRLSNQSLDNNSLSITPYSLSKPSTFTSLPYSGSFSGVNTEIYSNYIFSTTGHTDFYVDWNVTDDYPGFTCNFVIKLYNASGSLVLTTQTYNTNTNQGTWSTHFTGLNSNQNYYISFQNKGSGVNTSISGSFTAHY